MPGSLPPMLADAAPRVFSDAGWLYEPKLDGYRAIALLRDGDVRLLSRRGEDITQRYPPIVAALRDQPLSEAVFDGEVAALEQKGRPCFQCLQRYQSDPGSFTVIYYVFDLLHANGFDLRSAGLDDRRALLEGVLRTSEHVRLVQHFTGDAESIFAGALEVGFEGLIAKRRSSTYQSGVRSRDWLKMKATRSGDFIVGGYTAGRGSRSHAFGSLLLGHFGERGRLVYDGNVGTGFDEAQLRDLKQRMDELRTESCPFAVEPPVRAQVVWVRPELVAEVRYSERTESGYLRVAVFLRLRDDKPPGDVTEATDGRVPAAGPGSSRKDDVVWGDLLKQLEADAEEVDLLVEGRTVTVTNLDKPLWPAAAGRRALTKRDLLMYLTKAAPYMLPHLADRPVTLNRFPHGVQGDHFYQRHRQEAMPDYVDTVPLSEEKGAGHEEYLLCNNLPTLLWMGQMAAIEYHSWFSRIVPTGSRAESADAAADYPDFVIFDLDPFVYSGNEPEGAEPELNREAFSLVCRIALALKDVLDSLSLGCYLKTSGRTGLHVYVPIERNLDYGSVRSVAGTIGEHLLRSRPGEVTLEWSIEKRTGKVFFDYKQNVRGKSLASVWSPRISPEATVSMPLRWDDLEHVYPTDFTILNAVESVADSGDPWAGMMETRQDLRKLLSA